MAVYAYIRVSTEQQDGESQRFEIDKYCKAAGIKVDKWISESVSGTIAPDKRELGRLLKKMTRDDLMICSELSRLGRNMLMIMSILNTCIERGIHIHTIKDNFDLSDNLNSKVIAFAFSLSAEIERTLISQRTRQALALKKSHGVKLGRPNSCSRQRERFNKHAETIREMQARGWPLYRIAQHLGVTRNTLRRYLTEQDK